MTTQQATVPIQVESHAFSITNFQATATEELFHLVLSSSGLIRQYHVAPKHAKRILLLLQKLVEEYEKQFGILDTSLPQGDSTEAKAIGF